jgi:hypothetical protein
MVAATPGAHLHLGYVSDARFDEWIVASDVVVCPYRLIWSSGVLERARLYERPVIATRVGGLADQAGPGTVIVENDRELAAAMWRAAGAPTEGHAGPGVWADEPGELDRDSVMDIVRRRAAARRGAGIRSDAPLPDARDADRSAPVRRVPPLALPPAVSARPGATFAKRLVR